MHSFVPEALRVDTEGQERERAGEISEDGEVWKTTGPGLGGLCGWGKK